MKDIETIPWKVYWDTEPTNVLEITDGLVHGTFKVEVDGAYFILQRVNTNVFKEAEKVLENIILVNAHLMKDPSFQLEVPALVPTLVGDYFFLSNEGTHWRCFTFVIGSTTKTQIADPADAYAVAKAFGQFSASLSNLDPNSLHFTIEGFHDPKSRIRQFQDALEHGLPNRIAECKSLIEIVQSNFKIAEDINALALPLRVAHNDPKLTNVLFSAIGEPLSIIDLDTVMPGSPLHDFGDMVRSMAATLPEDDADLSNVKIEGDIYDQLEKGFVDGAGETFLPIEIENLSQGAAYIIYEQAMRFLTDYLNGDVYYRIDHKDHNRIRALNQLKLLQSLQELIK